MELTKRQEKILNTLTQEYIKSAKPVSSEFLDRKCKLGICPATIRIECQRLTDFGFIEQPHTSAGRIPTDKGYRFFVDSLFERGMEDLEIGDWFEEEIKNEIKFIQSLTKKLAEASRALVLSYLENEKIFLQDGWERILKEPEFEEKDYLISFAEFLENFERGIEDFEINSGIKIYIGRENPFKKAKDFSIISSKCYLPKGEEGIISLLGPKRMAYEKNIGLIHSLAKLLEKL